MGIPEAFDQLPPWQGSREFDNGHCTWDGAFKPDRRVMQNLSNELILVLCCVQHCILCPGKDANVLAMFVSQG